MELSSMAGRWSTEEDYPRINFRGRNENLRIIRSNLKQCPAFASKDFSKISDELAEFRGKREIGNRGKRITRRR